LHARIRDDDVLLNPFPAFHINCLDSALFPALVTGATAVIFEGFSASTFWKTVREEQATVVSVIPTVIRALNAQPARDDDLKHRVRLISGSLRPTAAELEEFLRRFGIARYETGYGLTEAGNAVTCTNAEVGCRPPSMGIPLFDRTVDLFDESRQPVPDGDTGEIVVKCEPSSAVMDGYWRDPEATQMAMTNGWLHTGDLARREPDGSYYFVGRIKEVIKRSGENVGAQEVDAALMDHPSIREIAVVGRPDAYRDEAVMAFIVLNDGVENLSLTEIRRFCAGRLAEFKMPSIISVVDDLPRGLLGKVDKKSLKLRAATYPHEENAVTSTDGGGSCTAP
jgi:crotonobetaine/carnitine-CoA ligase